MGLEGKYLESSEAVQRVATAAMVCGEVIQDHDGRAGIVSGLKAVAIGDAYTLVKCGRVELPKTTSMVLLAGGRAYWDRANSKVTYNRALAGAFYLGTVVFDAASADTKCVIDLNKIPNYRISWDQNRWTSVKTGTAASVTLARDAVGSRVTFGVTATSEAECADALSDATIAVADGPILECRMTLVSNGSTSAVDINIGLANATSTTDADAIAESVFFHVDGGSLNINAESDDGTTEVAATDTTVDAVEGTYNEYWIDARDPANVKLYIDGVRVLSSSTFVLTAATGPLKGLVHIEKTSGTATGSLAVEFMNVRSADLLT